MEFHFVKLNVNGTYLSLVDPTSKSRFICFTEVEAAERCIDYACTFKSTHGKWPCFDMSEPRKKIQTDTSVKLKSVQQLKRHLEIETYDFATIDQIARRSNVSFYCVLHFDAQIAEAREVINMRGQEMDGEADDVNYRDMLNLSLKIS